MWNEKSALLVGKFIRGDFGCGLCLAHTGLCLDYTRLRLDNTGLSLVHTAGVVPYGRALVL